MPKPSKSTKAVYQHSHYVGGQLIIARVKVVEGPTALLDRYFNVHLSFEQIEHLHGLVQQSKEHLIKDQQRVDDINKRNQE